MTDKIPSALVWAKTNGTAFTWWTPADNHEPTRATLHGKGWYYEMPEDDPRDGGIILDARSITEGRKFSTASDAVYLIDNGKSVQCYYVAGWNDKEEVLYLHSMPVNVNADGTPRLRADNKSPVDFSNWALGPRRAYHLKVSA